MSAAYVATAAICVLVACQNLLLAFRLRERRLHVYFSVAALGVAGEAMVASACYSAATAQKFLDLMPFGALFIVTTLISLSVFISIRFKATRSWMIGLVGMLGLATVVIDFLTGIAYIGPVKLLTKTLPWREPISFLEGATNPLRVIGDLALVGFLVILIDTAVQLVKRGDRRAAYLIGGSVLVYAFSLLMIIPVDMGIVYLPSLHTFAFLIIVASISWDLTNEAVRASLLSGEVIANERRWRQLLGDVQMLVARIDRAGCIVEVNPRFSEVLGYTTDDLVDRRYWDILVPDLREDRRAAFEKAMDGEISTEVEVAVTGKGGKVSHIIWRGVLLRDGKGVIEGILSLGTDVTAQVEAEISRDQALDDLEHMKERLEEENIFLREEMLAENGFKDIVGNSDALLYVLHKVRQVAPSDSSVLILGETGVGKELIARTIHNESQRATGPFVAVNCAAMPPNLIESELFGHERGAFTGAERRRRGRFELADRGTLFLDEIGDLPLEMQPKLLRVLQEGQIERVGGSETISVNVRVISATKNDLDFQIKTGTFREDLFYRIAVFPITVPPLRDRQEDIPQLVKTFVEHFAQRRGRRIEEIPSELMRSLQAYHWPGNIRELQNVIERAVLTSNSGVLRLAEPLKDVGDPGNGAREPHPENSRLTLDEVERRHIVQVLKEAHGQVSGSGGAAETLGLHANTLRYRMKKLGIKTGRKSAKTTVDS